MAKPTRKYFTISKNRNKAHLSESKKKNKGKFEKREEKNFHEFISLIKIGQTRCRIERDERGRVTSIGFYVYVGRVIGRDRSGGDACWCCIVYVWSDRTVHLYPLENPDFSNARIAVCNRIHKVRK